MRFYELVFIVRPDLSSQELDNLTSVFTEIIKKHEGEIIKNEYWGLKNLRYPIKNQKKASYLFIAAKMPPECQLEISSTILNGGIEIREQILRFSTQKVEAVQDTPPETFALHGVEVPSINVTQ